MPSKTTHKNISSSWNQIKFEDLYLTPSRNGLSKPSLIRGNGYKMVNMGELFRHEYILDDTGMELVPMSESEKNNSFLKKWDLLFARQSLVLSGVWKSAIFLWSNDQITFESHIIRVRINQKKANPFFFFYFFKSEIGVSSIMANASMLAAAGIRGSDLQKIKLLLPPLPEQNRIVAVLETWDRAIETLTQKIKVKKQIKKGLMQELLTGKTRLKGFSGKWEYVKLWDVCDIRTGKKNNQDKVENGTYPFFVRSPVIERINSYSYDWEAILVPGEGNIGKIFHYINGKFDFHQRVYKIGDFKKDIIWRYIYFYLLKNFSRATKSDSVKATVDSLRLPTFTNFKINLPEKEEQQKIVDVLTVADVEIENLEKKLSLLKGQKKYLLNNLITGEIRTPENLTLYS